MFVDVVVPAYSPALYEGLSKCIANLVANTPDINLIISSSELSQPKNINRGLNRASGEYIAILDWDVYVPKGWTKLFQDLRDDSTIGIVGAKMGGKYSGLNSTAPAGVNEWITLAGGCIAFRNIGLRWDENFPSGYWADTDFCRQYKERGYRVCIDGDVVVEHDAYTSGISSEGEAYYREKWGDNNL